MKTALLFFAFVAIAHSRPGETPPEIAKRFGAGEPLPATASLTSSMREKALIYSYEDKECVYAVTVYFWDNRSVREEYRFKAEKAANGQKVAQQKILASAGNGAPWTLEYLEPESGYKNTAEEIKELRSSIDQRGMYGEKHAVFYYKTKGLTAFLLPLHYDTLVIETDAFRDLRKSKEPRKPEAAPQRAKGF
jgi:hypothetical protein